MSRSNDRRIGAMALMPVAVAVLLLSACAKQEPPPVEDSAFSGQAAAMDKARSVEATMQQHKETMDQTLQKQENAGAE